MTFLATVASNSVSPTSITVLTETPQKGLNSLYCVQSAVEPVSLSHTKKEEREYKSNMSSNLHVVAADCLLFRNRFLWGLRGNIRPGSHHRLTCWQKINKHRWSICETLLTMLDSHWKGDYRDFYLPGEAAEKSGLVAGWCGSGRVGDPLLPDFIQ